MSRDRRWHERGAVRISHVEDYFRLHWQAQWHSLHRVHDVSISGMGIYFVDLIEVGTLVKIGFMSRDLELTVNGSVTWAQPSVRDLCITGNLNSYRLGIAFDPYYQDENMLMFMALRKYLDGFT